MKVVFMGTPDFSVPVLKSIINAGHQVGYVITQPDKARNRGKKVQFPPVKEVALKHNIPVLQPNKIKDSIETFNILKEFNPDIIVVVAYGQIIQKDILELPKFGCINVHASLLPKLRGASPIQHAILNGEEKSGVTIMQMEEGLDTGDMLLKAEVTIGDKNAEQLHNTLSELGGQLIIDALDKIEKGTIQAVKQDDSQHTYAGLIFKQDGKLDFSKKPEELKRQIRAFDPWPGAYCTYMDKQLKVWDAIVLPEETKQEDGLIIETSDNGIDVACGGMILRFTEIQLPGKKRIKVKDYLRGNSIEKGTKLG